jgi:DNA-binding SARP family transcriptional activator/TolB-like protein
MSRVLSLKLLGPFQIEEPRGLELATRKLEALVAFLALPAGRLRHRGELAELLWGSRDEAHARHSLSQALSALRKSLARAEINALILEGDRVGFDPGAVVTDVAHLTAILADKSSRALPVLSELWRGDLLAGLDIREEAFEDWLGRQRISAREGALEGFQRLLDQQSREGPTMAAIATARTILRIDPTHEETHRRLMALYVGRNQRNLALRQYRECATILRREFDIAPSAETRRLHEQLLRGSAASLPEQTPGAAPPPSVSAVRPKCGPPMIGLRKLAPATADAAAAAIADILNEDLLAAMSRDRSIAVVEQAPAANGALPAPTYALEGTIRTVGRMARVTAHLIDSASAACLWSEQRDLAHDEILGLDRSLALHLTATFRREIEAIEARKAAAGGGPAPDMWGWYHLGLREMYRFSMPGLRAAHQHFERAIALDPEFAAALARLAYVLMQMYWYGPREERAQNLEKGLAAAQQAVGLDPKSAHGHLALGRLCAIRGEFDLAIRELETAIALDGGFAQAHFGLGQAYAAAGDPANALAPLDRAIGLDPHDPHSWTFYHDRAEACFALGRVEEAERFSRIAVGLPNASHFAHATLVAVMGAAGKSAGTAAAVARLRRMKPDYAMAAAAEELGHHANQSFVGEYLAGLARAGLAA